MTVSNRSPRWLALVLIALAAGFTSGCATFFPETPNPGPKSLDLTVENHQWSGVTVYLTRDGAPFRLGFIEAQSEKTFRVSTARLGGAHSFQLYADVLGSRERIVTRPIEVMSGRTIWSLEASTSLSTVRTR